MKERLAQHRDSDESTCKNSRLLKWLRSLRESGQQLDVEVVECCEARAVDARERHWIAWFRKGWDLYNLEEGGRFVARKVAHIPGPDPRLSRPKKKKHRGSGRKKRAQARAHNLVPQHRIIGNFKVT